MNKLRLSFFCIILINIIIGFASLRADESDKHFNELRSYPVMIRKDTLFHISENFASFSAQERARLTNEKIQNLVSSIKKSAKDSLFFEIKKSNRYSEIFFNEISLITVTDDDARVYNTSKDSLLYQYKQSLEEYFTRVNLSYSRKQLFKNIAFSLIIILIAFSINYIILKFSYKFEMILLRLSEKPDYFVKIKERYSFNLKNLLYSFIYFYEGLKAILIIYVIYKSLYFFLSLIDLDNYWDFRPLFTGIFYTLTTTILFLYAYKLAKVFVKKVYEKFNKMKPKIMEKIQYEKFTLISEEKLIEIAKYSTRLLYNVSLVFLVYLYISLIFSYFTFTETWAEKLFSYILSPVEKTFQAFIAYLPNVFAIIVMYFLIKYTLKLIKFIFDAIENGTIVLPNFYQDWSEPTYKIVRFLVIVFGVIVVFPYLPGSNSPFFKGISVFVGILFSLGSSSAISNMVAGVVLTYMRPFKIGDVVKIGDTMGAVLEKTLLVSRIKTIKNVEITVPNAMILGSHIVNYSSSSQEQGLVLHTSVTIGYDVPWKTVHELLVKAALSTNLILKDPKPFVLQLALDDFYISYELNVYTKYPSRIPFIKSDLHQNIQDKFNEAGVEIMSPHYNAMRDGNQTTIPEKYLDENYQQPGFKIDPVTSWFSKREK